MSERAFEFVTAVLKAVQVAIFSTNLVTSVMLSSKETNVLSVSNLSFPIYYMLDMCSVILMREINATTQCL